MKKIVISCELNDIDKIKQGGEQTVGFEFFTNEKDTITLVEEIKQLLIKYNRPLMDIYCEELYYPGETMSTLADMEKSIKEGY